jgi:hypothetical protein
LFISSSDGASENALQHGPALLHITIEPIACVHHTKRATTAEQITFHFGERDGVGKTSLQSLTEI